MNCRQARCAVLEQPAALRSLRRSGSLGRRLGHLAVLALCLGGAARTARPDIPLQNVADTGQKGSLLVFPKVELRWNSYFELIQDTYVTLVNDYNAAVDVQLYFGCETNTWVDNLITLTKNEPCYWSVATGLPKGVSPFTVVGQPYMDPEAPGEYILRGYVVAWAVQPNSAWAINWNHLTGAAVIVDYARSASWEYLPMAFQCRADVAVGEPCGTPGVLNLDGFQYDAPPAELLLDFFTAGATLESAGQAASVADGDLTLLPLWLDLRQYGGGPPHTSARFTVYNENGVAFTGLESCIHGWHEALFTTHAAPNWLLHSTLQSDHARAVIDGVADPGCSGSLPGPLLAVGAQVLQAGGSTRLTALGVGGRGAEAGQILCDVMRADANEPRPTAIDDERRRAAAPSVGPDRVRLGRPGSLLVFPQWELRFTPPGDLIQDTLIQLSHDGPSEVLVRLYVVSESGASMRDEIVLGPDEPAHWSVFSGQPKGLAPASGLGEPYPDPEAPGEYLMQGWILAWAVSAGETEIHWNHLSGNAVVLDFVHGRSRSYDAYSFAALDQGGAITEGQVTGTPGVLQLDGWEYAYAFDYLLLNFYADGSTPFVASPAAATVGAGLTTFVTQVDLRTTAQGPTVSKAKFDIWNQVEIGFSGTEFCVADWCERLLNWGHFLVSILGTDAGRARIHGLASVVCDLPDLPSVNAPFLATQVRTLTYSGAATSATGAALPGAGLQAGQVLYEPDCNDNGISDDQDIAGGFSQDCNGNGFPDECEIDNGFSPDCQPNGIPDECELLLPDYPLQAGFEQALPPGWTATGRWHVAQACSDPNACEPPSWAYFGLDASCTFDTETREAGELVSPLIAVAPQAAAATLAYCSRYDGERGAASPPGGYDRAWVTVNGAVVDDVGPTSTLNEWQSRSVDLSAYIGQSITLAWHFDSVDAQNNDMLGWQVDDIRVIAAEVVVNDCNGNGVPDECEPDFDADGLIDGCDPDIDNDGVPNELDVCDFTPSNLPAELVEPDGSLKGDLDEDCDVDLEDFLALQLRFTGPRT